ncbi:hypothetical protein JTE90_007302 [Oedothorax gibbosus]|uniref:Uncharacterized protein n=1 Tax=Oedothorax gibbosus TaxID=931172 RepID=A0AAV6UDS7_9ARAC|nr:hypothetical protein JTE90_007302 [Oedothorax gibbosus]
MAASEDFSWNLLKAQISVKQYLPESFVMYLLIVYLGINENVLICYKYPLYLSFEKKESVGSLSKSKRERESPAARRSQENKGVKREKNQREAPAPITNRIRGPLVTSGGANATGDAADCLAGDPSSSILDDFGLRGTTIEEESTMCRYNDSLQRWIHPHIPFNIATPSQKQPEHRPNSKFNLKRYRAEEASPRPISGLHGPGPLTQPCPKRPTTSAKHTHTTTRAIPKLEKFKMDLRSEEYPGDPERNKKNIYLHNLGVLRYIHYVLGNLGPMPGSESWEIEVR